MRMECVDDGVLIHVGNFLDCMRTRKPPRVDIGSPEASPRGHGVPRRDVPGRVHVSADNIEPARDVRAGLLRPVLAPVGLTGAQPGDGVLDLRAAVRAPRGAGQFPLQAADARALRRGQARHVQQFTSGQGRGHGHAPVDADHLTVARCRDRVGNGRKGDVPAPGPVHGHPVGLHARRHRARPAEPHPPGLRYPHLSGFPAEPPHVPLLSALAHDPEPLVSASPGRPAGLRGRRTPSAPDRSRAGLLLHHLGADGQPGVRGAGGGELPTLLQVNRRAARPGYQCWCCSTARFQMNRAWPQWSRSTACWRAWGADGTETYEHTSELHRHFREVERRVLQSGRPVVSTPRSAMTARPPRGGRG